MKERKWLIVLIAVLLVFTTGCTLFNNVDDGPKSKRITLNAYATSEETDNSNDVAANAIDGDESSFWHTKWNGDELPQSITIKVSEPVLVHQLKYLPRQDNENNGIITQYEIKFSVDGENFDKIAEGEWEVDKEWKKVEFESVVEATEIRLVALEGAGGFASAAEIELSFDRIEDDISNSED